MNILITGGAGFIGSNLARYLLDQPDVSGICIIDDLSTDRVQFLGYRRDIPDMLAVADVLCLPSFREGLPLTVMEAMASETSVVASQVSGVADLIDDGEGGILVGRADDVDGFASALDALSKDPALRLAMGHHNRERVTAFSTVAVADALAGVYGIAKNAALGETS